MNTHRASEKRLQSAHMRWNGKAHGISWGVALWGLGSVNNGAGMLNGYLSIDERLMPAEEFDATWWLPADEDADWGKPFPAYHYGGLPVEGDSEITYYGKESGFDGAPRIVKVGWDYGHLWHREQGYWEDVDIVVMHCAQAAERLRERHPHWLWPCSYSRCFAPFEAMTRNKNGNLVCAECVPKIDPEWDWFPATEPMR